MPAEEDIHLATRCAGKRIGAIVDGRSRSHLARSARRSIGISKSQAATYVRTYIHVYSTCVRAFARLCTCAQVDSPDLEHPPVGGRLTESRIHLSSKQRGGRDA